MTAVMGDTGIRKGEALTLKWSNLKMSQKVLTVGRSKNRKVRDVPLSDFAIGWLGKLVRYIEFCCPASGVCELLDVWRSAMTAWVTLAFAKVRP